MTGNVQIIFAVVVFLISYAIIVTEVIHRTIIALFGAGVMVIFGVLTYEYALESIDFNVLGLLVGMMLIVGLTRESGIFECIAVAIAKLGKGKPMFIMVSLSIMTAVMSAFIDSVTMILLVVPVSISIARKLGISPMPIVFTEILLCNIGGATTLIGDPPNLLIGSAAGFGFMDFVFNVGPVMVVIGAVTLFILWLMFRKRLVVDEESKQYLMEMNPKDELKDKKLAIETLSVMVLTIVGFILHKSMHLESATVAMGGAALLLLVVRPDPKHVFRHVEWEVIFFFLGLFILVGGIRSVGVIEWLATQMISLTGGRMVETGMMVLWLSSVVGAFVDNIPFTATMVPLIQDIGHMGVIANMDPIWWCLVIGACLGGNGTMIAASPNVVAVGLLEQEGYKFTFMRFMAMAFPLMILSVLIATVYLYFLYLT